MSTLREGVPAPRQFPVLPLRSGALFPGVVMSFALGRKRSIALLDEVSEGDVIAVFSQRDRQTEEPKYADLHPRGTFARVQSVQHRQGKPHRLVVEGLDRVDLEELSADSTWHGVGTLVADLDAAGREAQMLAEELTSRLSELDGSGGALAETIQNSKDDLGLLADRVAAGLGLATPQAMELLEERRVPQRLRRTLELMGDQQSRAEVHQLLEKGVRDQLGKRQKEMILREQLEIIRRELGEDDDSQQDELLQRLRQADLPAEIRAVTDRELARLRAGAQGPEASVIRTYLDWVASLPWSARAETEADIDALAARLEADHFGMEKVKKRILEHMAVAQLSGNPRGTVLCLVGPPGVGKTSLGQSIADATKRPFVRIALGGVRDEAEIRGHRRTYVGALPGRIIHGLKQAGVKNPVVLLDEVDKLGQGWGGSPEAALLEVLDPEQNHLFTDHYLEQPFDLSEVLFICTANSLETLSAPLRDRLEIVELSGYTQAEKEKIAERHLIPKRLRESGIPDGGLSITPEALSRVVAEYTREAGVRQLDRELTRLARSVALEVARNQEGKFSHTVDAPMVPDYLGKPRFKSEVREQRSAPGVATGLAWTPVGGDILFIETSRMPGRGKLEITGQLGDVMKESARAALTYVRSHSKELGIDDGLLERQDLHIHVPAGAVPKDGPSAGVTIFTALASLLSGRAVRADTAMTGECTLRGRVLPVGGIKAKVLAAHRAGIRRVILPGKNEGDLADIPADTLADMEVVFAHDMSDVLEYALEHTFSSQVDSALAAEPGAADSTRAVA